MIEVPVELFDDIWNYYHVDVAINTDEYCPSMIKVIDGLPSDPIQDGIDAAKEVGEYRAVEYLENLKNENNSRSR